MTSLYEFIDLYHNGMANKKAPMKMRNFIIEWRNLRATYCEKHRNGGGLKIVRLTSGRTRKIFWRPQHICAGKTSNTS